MSPTINKYLEKLNDKLKEKDNFFYVYRGHASEDWELDCTALRLANTQIKDLLKENQMKQVDDAKMKGLHHFANNQRKMSDLELLADLRHYSAPSCLIDFTSNFLVALWFACEEEKNFDDNAKVLILNCYETYKFLRVSHKIIEKDISYFLGDDMFKLWYWIPERINQRTTDQDAVFVFGAPKIREEYYDSIKVDNDDKKQILEELERFFDYSRSTLFSDKYAIGDNFKKRDINKPEYDLDQAVYYIQTQEPDKAEGLLNKIIMSEDTSDNKSILSEAHFQMGYVKLIQIANNMRKNINKKEIHKGEVIKYMKLIFVTEKEYCGLVKNKGMDDMDVKYSKSFRYCLKNKYKTEEIENIMFYFYSFAPTVQES